MMEILTELFRTYLGGNRGPDGAPPDYGIAVTRASDDLRSITVTLTLKRGCRYCCSERCCHFSPCWNKLRDLAGRLGVTLGSPLEITVVTVVEVGARFDVYKAFGLPETEASGWTDRDVIQESPAPDSAVAP